MSLWQLSLHRSILRQYPGRTRRNQGVAMGVRLTASDQILLPISAYIHLAHRDSPQRESLNKGVSY